MLALASRGLLVYVLFLCALMLGGTAIHYYTELRLARGDIPIRHAGSSDAERGDRTMPAGAYDRAHDAAAHASEHATRQVQQLLDAERTARQTAELRASDAAEALIREQLARVRAESAASRWQELASSESMARQSAETRTQSLEATLAHIVPPALAPGAGGLAGTGPQRGAGTAVRTHAYAPDAGAALETSRSGRRLRQTGQTDTAAAASAAPSFSDMITIRD